MSQMTEPLPASSGAPAAETTSRDDDKPAPGQLYERHAAYHRVTHILIIISFVGLVLTGMPIKFSEAAWSHVLFEMLGGFEACRFLHRFFAVVTFFYFFLHLRFRCFLHLLAPFGLFGLFGLQLWLH